MRTFPNAVELITAYAYNKHEANLNTGGVFCNDPMARLASGGSVRTGEDGGHRISDLALELRLASKKLRYSSKHQTHVIGPDDKPWGIVDPNCALPFTVIATTGNDGQVLIVAICAQTAEEAAEQFAQTQEGRGTIHATFDGHLPNHTPGLDFDARDE